MRDSNTPDLEPHATSTVRIGTYNILNPFHAVKWRTAEGLNEAGDDNWDQGRAQTILDNLRHASLDLCALQEVSARTYPLLAEASLDQGSCGLSLLHTHATREPEGAHGVAVLYQRARFELIRDVGLKTREEEHRSASCVDLRERESGRVYRVISVHLKGYNPYELDLEHKREAQKRGDHELKSYLGDALAELDGVDGVFVLGDFNEDAPEMEARGITSRQGQLIQAGFTWSGVIEPTEVKTERQIDWIFYRDLRATEAPTLTRLDVARDTSGSDHSLTGVRVSSL